MMHLFSCPSAERVGFLDKKMALLKIKGISLNRGRA